jgi:uncharacterized protein YdhG (YjbR/CyaY superfamily)
MQSNAKTVAAYLQEVPAERRAALTKFRKLCRSTLKGYRESMDYGGPSYSKNGVVEVGFASQKNFIGFYILKKPVLDAYRAELKGISVGKGAIRYANPEKIDWDVVKKLLVGTNESVDVICG